MHAALVDILNTLPLSSFEHASSCLMFYDQDIFIQSPLIFIANQSIKLKLCISFVLRGHCMW